MGTTRITMALLVLGACMANDEAEAPPTEDPAVLEDDPVADPTLPPPSETAALLAAEWSGCLNPEDFSASMMAPAWGTLASTTGGTCSACHSSGNHGFVATTNEPVFFDAITQHRSVLLTFFRVDLSDLANPKIVVNGPAFASIASQLAPYAAHPGFDVNNPGMAALHELYDLTVARKAAGDCGPPRLID